MPPRRATRASSSSRLFDNSSEAGGPLENVAVNRLNPDLIGSPGSATAVGRGMSPGPAKYSSAYGSPPTIVPTRQNVARQRYNFSSALSHVVDAVEKDNENDARERAQRDVEQQGRAQSVQPTAPAKQPTPQPTLEPTPEQSDESAESVELVREQDDNLEQPAESASTETLAPAPIFTEAEHIFAEAQISTPSIPRQSVVAKTSNILHSIFSSARRITTTRDDSDFENARQSFPQLQFFRPRTDTAPAEVVEPYVETTQPFSEPAQAEPETASAASTTTTTTTVPTGAIAVRVGNVAKSLKSRILTPGPGQRNRRSLFKPSHDTSLDELATNTGTPASAILSARSLLGRRRPLSQVQVVSQSTEEPRPDRQDRERSERPERQRRSQPPEVSSSVKNAQSRESSSRPIKTKIAKSYSTQSGFLANLGVATKLFSFAITLIVFGLIALRVFVVTTSPPELYEGYRVDNRLRWYGSDWRSNMRQLVPFALVHPLGAISDDEFAKMNGIILSHANEVAQMKHANRLNAANLERINRILPAMVHMDLDRHGRPVISQDFWHALKDNIQADRDIFSLIWNKDGSMGISDLQWTALKRHLQASGFVPADPDTKALTISDVEGIAADSLSKSWEAWLRKNERKVKDILHIHNQVPPPSQPQQKAPDYDELASHMVESLSSDQIAKLARQITATREVKEVLVPRQDFLQILQTSFIEHRVEIKGEMAELEERVIEVARAAALAVKSSLSSSIASRTSPVENGGAVPTGLDPRGGTAHGTMTKKEIMSLVDQLVRKTVSDAQLEAMSRGKIKSNWQTNLINQVNFFSRNSGAAVNHHFSSPSFSPSRGRYWTLGGIFGGRKSGGASGASHRGGGKVDSDADSDSEARPRPGLSRGSVIFDQWEQDGDCWCAATDLVESQNAIRDTFSNAHNEKPHKGARHPATVAVKLGLRILPQYLVVEHISPSATLDPGAMPKDLELWIQITDYEQRRPLQDWSSNQFGDGQYGASATKASDDNLLDWGFIKVGEYTFDGAGGSTGSGSTGISGLAGAGAAQVFRVSPELEALGVATDQVIVRAMTNHGSSDHTCFYRVRMYGQRRD
ncbi:spindle pole body-associated protein sad1 [Ophiostoma piceae UAMH 11346]|uniref:Spindle pole body-associated protein sad1 n=1 Tax=Ophiostoma piceae (strain UAMH 11346) TaxID=1262450 RepID=S3BZP7_OPHP1|nr:spindle pole body-associated protein sad1 [Ophiostoma piceae UAMH 11346]